MRTRRIGGKPVFRQIAVLGLAIHCFVFSLPPRSAAENAPSSHAAADSELLAENPPGDPLLLPPVVVTAENLPLTGSGTTINREIIEKLPLRNNSINEALTILPGVQLSEEAYLSTQGGEILPPKVSIAGGKCYDNNFTIDGFSNNSLLDPISENAVDLFDVQGHPQGLFLDPALIEKVTVFDSNVPASYGSFKGGVVEATTLIPDPFFNGRFFYRTTRDQWTSFHLNTTDKEDFPQSRDQAMQPEFEKHHTGLELHIPLTPKIRLLAFYSQEYSEIALNHFGNQRDQHRRQQNLFLKLSSAPSPVSTLDLTWVYSPYEAHYFFKNYQDSDYSLHQGGSQISAEYRTSLDTHELHLLVGYGRSENRRDAPKDAKKWQITPSKNWGETVGTTTSNEGFYGDLDKSQESGQFKADLTLSPFFAGSTSHQFNTGIDYQHTKGSFDRKETSYYYYSSKLDSQVSCDGNTSDCVEGEQYFGKRFRYPKNKAEATINQLSVYLEDILTFKRLELRPGVRLSDDDFMENLDIAPRLAATVDIFGNSNSLLITGYNRYYANTLLTYKLREARTPLSGYMETRKTITIDGEHRPTDWERFSTTYKASKYSDLKTPYADEYVLGLNQAFLGGRLTAKYVQRENKDEFAREIGEVEENGLRYYTLNNNGRSRYRSYRLSWERQWRNHSLLINGTYERTTTSNETYDDDLEEENLQDQVWYDGHLVKKTELPRKDFNRPWVVNLVYVGKFPYGFTFSGLAKYRSGYRVLEDTGEDKKDIVLADDSSPPIYEEVKKGGSVIVSCRIDWEKRLWLEHSMVLSLEANNLLNKKSPVSNTDNYEIGRQVWAGLEYRF